MPAFVRGGTYGSQIADGRVKWHSPFKSDCNGDVAVAAIRRLVARTDKHTDPDQSNRSSPPSLHIELHNGEELSLGMQCILDTAGFAEALYRVNPEIRFESEGFTILFAGDVPWKTV